MGGSAAVVSNPKCEPRRISPDARSGEAPGLLKRLPTFNLCGGIIPPKCPSVGRTADVRVFRLFHTMSEGSGRRFPEQGFVVAGKTTELPEAVARRDLGYSCRAWRALTQGPPGQTQPP